MIINIFKLIFYFIIVLIVFALLPSEFLEKLKTFFNWDNFLRILKKGWERLINFIQETIGLDFNKLFRLQENLRIDFISWATIKNFLANIFEKLANLFK